MRSRYRLGIDVGGTFTDLQAMNEESGALYALKTPSTAQPEDAVVRGIQALGERFGIAPADIGYFSHGTTLGVNTLLERSGGRVGVLTTQGFRDILELRRLRLPKANDFFVKKPVSLVPRRLIQEVDERVLADGSIRAPIGRADVEAKTRKLVEDGAEAIAICFLHAYRNRDHESRAKAWVGELFPDLYVCTSAEIWPQQREYERFLVSVINAYIGRRMRGYFERLEGQTAALWMRIMIREVYGIQVRDVTWYNGREAAVSHAVQMGVDRDPPNVPLIWVHESGQLNRMLHDGEIDAAFGDAGVAPIRPGPNVRPLFAEDGGRSIVEAFYRKTRFTPVNHTLVVQRRVLERDPWVAESLFEAFEESKQQSYRDARQSQSAFLLFPGTDFSRQEQVFGPDPYPSGLTTNRRMLAMAAQESLDEGLTHTLADVDELFWETVRST